MIRTRNQILRQYANSIESTPPTVQVTGQIKKRSHPIETDTHFVATEAKIQTSPEINAVVNSITELSERLMSPDPYTFSLQYEVNNERRKVTHLLASDYFKQLRRKWETFGIQELSTANERVRANKVGLYIQRDNQNLVSRLKIETNFHSFACSNNATIDFEVNEVLPAIEKVKKYNLYYLKDLKAIEQQVNHLVNQLEYADQRKRTSLLDEFNEQHKVQLRATLTYYAGSRKRELKVHDISGAQVFTRAFTDPTQNTTTGRVSVITNHLQQPKDECEEQLLLEPNEEGTNAVKARRIS